MDEKDTKNAVGNITPHIGGVFVGSKSILDNAMLILNTLIVYRHLTVSRFTRKISEPFTHIIIVGELNSPGN